MKNLNRKKSLLNNYARYSGLAFQMLAIILIGVWVGIKLDEWLKMQIPVFTVLLSVIFVFLAVYSAIREFLKKK
jgi:F0F1-type ATP synthase assembly protein I